MTKGGRKNKGKVTSDTETDQNKGNMASARMGGVTNPGANQSQFYNPAPMNFMQTCPNGSPNAERMQYMQTSDFRNQNEPMMVHQFQNQFQNQYLQTQNVAQHANVGQQDGQWQSTGQLHSHIPQTQLPVAMNESLQMIMNQIQQSNSTVLTRLTAIENNVAKLAPMEQNISTLLTDVAKLKRDNDHLSKKVSELEISCQSMSSLFDKHIDIQSKIEKEMSDIKRENRYLSQKVDESTAKLETVTEEMLDMKSRAMRENLLFFGIEETRERNREDTESLLRAFLKKEVLPDTPG